MGAVLFLLGTWPRRRRLALGGVAFLAAASLGFVLLAGLGANRANTAWQELREQGGAEDVLLNVTSIDAARRVAQSTRQLPEVERAVATAYVYLTPEGRQADFFGGTIIPLEPGALRELWRPVLTAGRGTDPARADEVVVNQLFVEVAGLGVGDRFTLVDPVALISQPVTIVGVGLFTSDFTYASGSPIAYPTEAFSEKWDAELQQLFAIAGREGFFPAVLVSRSPGVDAVELTSRLVAALPPEDLISVDDASSTEALAVDTLDLQRNGYLALAIVGASATLSMLTLAVYRVVRIGAREAGSLSALGFTRQNLRLAMVLPAITVVAVAIAGAFAVATVAQGLVPTGLARRVGPRRALGDDIVFLAASTLILAAAFVGLVVAATWTAERGDAARAAPVRAHPTLLRWPPLGAGLRAASGGIASAGRRQAGAAAAAVFIASVGIVAVDVVVRSRDGLRADLSRIGKFFDVAVATYTDSNAVAADGDLLAASSAVTGLATIEIVSVEANGIGTPAITVTALKGGLGPTMIAGRQPIGPDEVVVSLPFLRRLGRGIEDTIEIEGTEGTARFRVVGTAALPNLVQSGVVGEQLAFTVDGRAALGVEPDGYALVAQVADAARARSFRSGYDDLEACDSAVVLGLLGVERLPGAESGALTPCVPRSDPRVSNLDELGALPGAITGFLAMLGIAGLAYLLSASLRQARRDLAVLRVLGFTRPQSVVTVLVQSGAIALVGALAALPFGIAFGRAAWRGVAEGIGIVVVSQLSFAGTIGLVAGALLVAGLLAVPFATRAVNRSPAALLRTE